MRPSWGKKLYYSIGEVAELTDLQPYTLRAWEKEFSCLRPRRIRGKNRSYRERDIGIILLIKRLLHDERYSTRGVRQKLKNEPELVRGAADEIATEWAIGDPERQESPTPSGAPLASTAGGDAAETSSRSDDRAVDEWLESLRSDLKEVIGLLA